MSVVQDLQDEGDRTLAKAERYEQMLFALGAMEKSPCFVCGYNGKGYFQPDQHPCAKHHHAAIHAARCGSGSATEE